ncbi:MAG TPA: helix-turn-helix transcriptional regulator [Chloroflexia bacterium]|nr:helix-turn-helix transcriptional regulator [Chloroflexia bacterium]
MESVSYNTQRGTLGQRIQEARLKQGLSQEEIAGGEFSAAYISAVEGGSVRPSLKALEVLASRLGLPAGDLSALAEDLKTSPDLNALQEDFQFQLNYAKGLIQNQQIAEALELISTAEQSIRPYEEQVAGRYRYRIPYLRGLAHLHREEYVVAQRELEASLELAETDEEASVRVHNFLGVALYQQERIQEAVKHHTRCLRAIQNRVVKDLNLRVSVYRNLANDYWALSDFAHAVPMYKEALALLEDLDSEQRKAHVCWGLAMAYKETGYWSQAKLYGMQALMVFEGQDNQDPPMAAAVRMNIAEILIGEGRYAEAEEMLERAGAYLAGSDDQLLLANLDYERASLAHQQGRLEQAAEHIARNIERTQEVCRYSEGGKENAQANARRAHAEALHMAALIERDSGNQDAADTYFRQALTCISRTGFEELRSTINFSYAETLKARGAFELATEYYRVALQLRLHPTHKPPVENREEVTVES